MKLWVLDTNLVVDLLEGDPSRKTAVSALAASASDQSALLAITAISVQEYLVRPRKQGLDTYHRARKALTAFRVLQYDQAAAEEAAKIEWTATILAYRSGGTSNTAAKAHWFRDAAIVGTAVARGAECVYTRDASPCPI